MKKTAVLLLIFLSLSTGSALYPSQEQAGKLVLNLEECLDMALRQNPFHLGAQEREDQARALVREAAAQFFPSLNAQGTDNLVEKLFFLEFPSLIPGEPPQRIEVDFTRDYQMTMALSLPVYAGGRITAGHRQAKDNLLATQESVRLSRQETIFNVKTAFFGHLLAKEFVAVAEEALDLAERQYEDVRNLYEVGMASKFDLLRTEVRMANLKPQLIRARNDLDVSALNLKMLLGIDLNRPIEVVGELSFTPLEIDVEDATERALFHRPEIRQMNHQRSMAGEMLKIAKASFIPVVSLSGTYNLWADRLSFARGTWQNFYSINLTLALPILNGFENHARVGQSKAMIRELDWQRKGLEEKVKFEVRQALLNYHQSRESLLSQGKNVEQAQEAVRIAELNFKEGLATVLDVGTTQMALSQAQTNYSQALFDCAVSLAQLEKAIGEEESVASSELRRRP